MTAKTASKTETGRTLFSGSMKLSDLLDINYRLLPLLPRIGIPFGFGEDTVEEACRKNGVNASTFLLICNVYTFDGYRPPKDMLRRTDLRDIVKYLHQSHTYYMDSALQALSDGISRMIEPCEERQKKVIRRFFQQYKEEVAKHFGYEENTVFPYVLSVLGHTGGQDYTILQYEENHSNIEEKLDDLKNIVMKYLPAGCDNSIVSDVLQFMFLLGEDLQKHTMIEDEILIPMVNRLEEEQ